MKVLIIANDPPYGTERLYNALRLGHAMQKREDVTEVAVFLLADAVSGAKKMQKTPEGFYNIERMLKRLVIGKGRLLICGTCLDARGLTAAELVEGAERSTMDELAAVTALADKVLVF